MSTIVETRPGGVEGSPPDSAPLQVNLLLERMTFWLDNAIPIPGTPWRVGLDGVLGLVPGVGDAATLIAAVLMWQEGRRLGLPRRDQAVMLGNYALDALLGTVPLVGDLFDFGFKAHQKSLRLLQRHVEAVNRTRG